jgi:hypothetical protein
MSEADRAALNTLLRGIDENWETEAAHEALLQFAQEHSLLPQVARFYRENLENAGRRELSEKKLVAIQVLAFSFLESTRADDTGPSRIKKVLALLVTSIFLGCALTLLRLFFSG